MKNKEAVFEALKEGKNLISCITGIQYTLIKGVLHARHCKSNDWKQSELNFYYKPSWLNLRIMKETPAHT